MLKKIAICTLGLATGIGVAATTQPVITEVLGYKKDDDVVVTPMNDEESDSATVMPSEQLAASVDRESSKVEMQPRPVSTTTESETVKTEPKSDLRSESVKPIVPVEEVAQNPPSKVTTTSKTKAPVESDTPPRRVLAKAELEIDGYEAKTHEVDGYRLPYRMLRPKKLMAGKSYPLVIFLHGAGERGSDNAAQLKHAAHQFASYLSSENMEAFVVCPQCPTDQQWSELKWSETQHEMSDDPSSAMKAVMSLMDRVLVEEPVDEDRIYAAGLSMGGYGVLDLVARRPKMFAAVASCCGGSDCSEPVIRRLAGLPLYIVHGDADGVVDVQNARRIVDKVELQQGDVVYKELAGVGHDCWTATFNDSEFFEWLFSKTQKKTSDMASLVVAEPIRKETVVARKPTMPKVNSDSHGTDPVAPLVTDVATSKSAADSVIKEDVAEGNPRPVRASSVAITNGGQEIADPGTTGKSKVEEQTKKLLLEGEWKVAKGIYNGKPIPSKVLKRMSLVFKNRLLTMKQGQKEEKGKIVVGETMVVDGKSVQALKIVSERPGMPDIDALYFAENDGAVMIWNAPGEPRPTTIEPDALPKSRIMWLQR